MFIEYIFSSEKTQINLRKTYNKTLKDLVLSFHHSYNKYNNCNNEVQEDIDYENITLFEIHFHDIFCNSFYENRIREILTFIFPKLINLKTINISSFYGVPSDFIINFPQSIQNVSLAIPDISQLHSLLNYSNLKFLDIYDRKKDFFEKITKNIYFHNLEALRVYDVFNLPSREKLNFLHGIQKLKIETRGDKVESFEILIQLLQNYQNYQNLPFIFCIDTDNCDDFSCLPSMIENQQYYMGDESFITSFYVFTKYSNNLLVNFYYKKIQKNCHDLFSIFSAHIMYRLLFCCNLNIEIYHHTRKNTRINYLYPLCQHLEIHDKIKKNISILLCNYDF